MKYIAILVEGFTELNFVDVVLKPHLLKFGIFAVGNQITTLRREAGGKMKGGTATYKNFKIDVKGFLGDTSKVLVTMMLDFYALPKSFPGFDSLPEKDSCYQQVAHLENALKNDIGHVRFLPYFSLYEFEAVLFADVESVTKIIHQNKDRLIFELNRINQNFVSPEEINLINPPAKRIEKLVPEYEKDLHGPLIASEIGLEKIRAACPHFAEWLGQLEALGNSDYD